MMSGRLVDVIVPDVAPESDEEKPFGMPDRSSPVEFLLALANKVAAGDLVLQEFKVNPSVSDPCRMMITIATTRGSSIATGLAAVEYAAREGKVAIDRTLMKQYERAYRREKQREEEIVRGRAKTQPRPLTRPGESILGNNGRRYLEAGSYYVDENGIKWPHGQGPLYGNMTPGLSEPEWTPPPKPEAEKKPERDTGARSVLDLD
jgi:hypothetical protein